MALVLTVAVGDVVDIADGWIAQLSVDSRTSATVIMEEGEKATVSSTDVTEIMPRVWLQLGPSPGRRRCQFLIDAPQTVPIRRRQRPHG